MNNETEKLKLIEARLTEAEKSALERFNSDPGLVIAVEKVLMYQIQMMGVVRPEDKDILDVNWAFLPRKLETTDAEFGREIKVKIDALSFLGDAFKQVRKFTREKPSPFVGGNPALGK